VIDAPLVVRKMALISADLREIMRLADRPPEQYLADPHAQVLAERYLERVIGRMIDINYHLLTAAGQPPPKDYYESFIKLGTMGVLAVDLARELATSTGLRNRIAHEYDDIDHAKVHAGLAAAARDVPQYLRSVQARLDSGGP
jgi:uncharacterized protein YutE (UPF0331/DUF86 family)